MQQTNFQHSEKGMYVVTWLFTLLLLILCAVPGFAGDGKFHGPTWNDPKTNYDINQVGTIDINVLLDSTLTGADWTDEKLKEYFTRISRELYNAAERQVQLGKVRVYRGAPEAKKKADILVSDSIPGAYTTAGNFGKPGAYSKIYSNDRYLTSAARPVIVHEMGHLVFSIYDSYVGWLKNPADNTQYLQPKSDLTGYEFSSNPYRYDNAHDVPAPDHITNTFYDPTPHGDGSIACIMDGPDSGQTEFGTPTGNTWVTDHLLSWDKTFAWPTAPNGNALNPPFTATATVVTMQNQDNNNESAWETIVRTRPSMQLPIAQPQNSETGHIDFDDDPSDDVVFVVVPAINELSLCIDRSGSMSGTPMTLAKTAAGLVVALTHEGYEIEEPKDKIKVPVAGDHLSVTSFSSTASTVFSDSGRVAEMTLTNKVLAAVAIASIRSGGMTSIGSGLIQSRNTFGNDGNVPQSIILLSDGHENTSPYISQVRQSLLDRGIRVYAVGLGSGADKALLRSVADATGGEFFFADNAFQLPGIFATFYGNIRNDGFLKIVGGVLNAITETTRTNGKYIMLSPQAAHSLDSFHSETVTVDDKVVEATFLVTWDQGVGNIDLIDPDGNVITRDNYQSFPGIAYSEETGFVMYRVAGVVPGEWQVELDFDGTPNVQWELKVFSIDAYVQFEAQTEKTTYVYPEPVIIRASCLAPEPVIGGQAMATVMRPGGSTVTLTLFDDGKVAISGDEVENDGIYSGLFASFSENGVYTVTAQFDSTGGVTPTPSNTNGIEFAMPEPGAPPLIPEPVGHFQRQRQFTFTISGVPDVVSAMVHIDPETLNTKGKGKFITAYVELIEPYDVSDIQISSVVLKDGSAIVDSALLSPSEIGNHDLDAQPDLMVKFSRGIVIDHLISASKTSCSIEFTVEGRLESGESFSGSSVVQVISPNQK